MRLSGRSRYTKEAACDYVRPVFFWHFLFTMTKVDTKEGISRENLELHRIFYHPCVYQVPYTCGQATKFALPEHVDAVRDALLSFDKIIPEDWEEHLYENFAHFGSKAPGPAWTHQPPESAFIPLKTYERNRPERSIEWTKADKNLKGFEVLAKYAQGLLQDAESEWDRFWRSRIFMSFTDEAYGQNGHQ